MSRNDSSQPARAADPRPGRTRSALFDALVQLIQEKRWDRIRVQDLLDRTGLGRSTFYAHFDNKFDLLTAAIPDLLVPIEASGDDLPDLLPLFEHVAEMQPILVALMSQPLLSAINDTFHTQLKSAWGDHLTGRGIDGVQVDFAANFLAGGFLAVSREWLASGCQRPAAEVCADYRRYAGAIIGAV